MRHVYLAHPYGGLEENLTDAKQCYLWASNTYWGTHTFHAMWIINCEVYNDADEEERLMGMSRNFENIKRCDELWLFGPRVSTGMYEEAVFACVNNKTVFDITGRELEEHTPIYGMPIWSSEEPKQGSFEF